MMPSPKTDFRVISDVDKRQTIWQDDAKHNVVTLA
jgi:hypothetical protein